MIEHDSEVALILTGQAREPSKCIPSIKKHVIDVTGCDVHVHACEDKSTESLKKAFKDNGIKPINEDYAEDQILWNYAPFLEMMLNQTKGSIGLTVSFSRRGGFRKRSRTYSRSTNNTNGTFDAGSIWYLKRTLINLMTTR